MLEDVYFKLFQEKLNEAVVHVGGKKRRENPAIDAMYLSKWVPCSLASKAGMVVVSSDGSNASSKFAGGLGVYVARAVANIYNVDGVLVDAVIDVDVAAGYQFEGESMLMRALELRTLASGIEKAKEMGKPVLAIFDGALYPTVVREVSKSEDVDMAKLLLKSYIKLFRTAGEGVVVVGVSKDSNVSYLRSAIMLEAIASMEPALASKIGVTMKPKELAKSIVESTKRTDVLALADDLLVNVSDEALYSSLASSGGYTMPLVIPPQPRFGKLDRFVHKWSWLQSAGGFRGTVADREVLSLLDELYSLTPVVTTYWRPLNHQGAHRVDLLGKSIGSLYESGAVSDFAFVKPGSYEDKAVASVVSELNSMMSTSFSVDPLIQADVNARLERRVFDEAYEPMIAEALKKAGFDVDMRRRALRDLVMRGY
jgi:hypothetical protein